MSWRIASLELGKQLLNIGVAGLVFAFIQPLVHGELTVEKSIWAIIWYAVFTSIGVFLIAFGSRDER